MNRVCHFCRAYDAGKSCSLCQNRFYCNKKCQVADWPQHRHECADQMQAMSRLDELISMCLAVGSNPHRGWPVLHDTCFYVVCQGTSDRCQTFVRAVEKECLFDVYVNVWTGNFIMILATSLNNVEQVEQVAQGLGEMLSYNVPDDFPVRGPNVRHLDIIS